MAILIKAVRVGVVYTFILLSARSSTPFSGKSSSTVVGIKSCHSPGVGIWNQAKSTVAFSQDFNLKPEKRSLRPSPSFPKARKTGRSCRNNAFWLGALRQQCCQWKRSKLERQRERERKQSLHPRNHKGQMHSYPFHGYKIPPFSTQLLQSGSLSVLTNRILPNTVLSTMPESS